jgi:predicted Co/Zn/Cd cation transporter (cation efflux family)
VTDSTVRPGDDERRLLWWSMGATGAAGVVGVAWGIAAQSQMILLDGVYAVIGIVLSALLLVASRLAGREPTRRFPFGLEGATPLAIAVQAFVQLATLLYAAVEAVYTIRLGGSEVAAGSGIAYGVLVTALSVVVARELARRAGHSDLLVSEAAAWRVGAWRGVGMIAGFGVLALVADRGVAPYVDPAMVLVTCVALLPTPLRLLRQTGVELLSGAPIDATLAAVEDHATEVTRRHGLAAHQVHVSKVGPKLFVEFWAAGPADMSIAAEHVVRTDLLAGLDALPYEVWLSVEVLPYGATFQDHRSTTDG